MDNYEEDEGPTAVQKIARGLIKLIGITIVLTVILIVALSAYWHGQTIPKPIGGKLCPYGHKIITATNMCVVVDPQHPPKNKICCAIPKKEA